MKVALIHYWLTGMRGGEKVLEAFCELFPDADIFTHACQKESLSPRLRSHHIRTTFINRLPFASRLYKAYLPLMPMALECLDLTEYDLVISSESGPAKGVITRPDALHVCYCHSPMRYLWDLNPTYRQRMSWLQRAAFAPLAHYLRLADVLSATRVDEFIANSQFVRNRIHKYYRREAVVIHPPVDTDYFSPSSAVHNDYYLVAGQLVHYKRVDLAVSACSELSLPLVVAGEGPELARLRRQAGPSVKFIGRVDDQKLRALMVSCKALLFPGVEDFGMIPIEAMACGRPVIALNNGGAAETVVADRTGILFNEQHVNALKDAVMRLESKSIRFDPAEIRAHAVKFGKSPFFHKITALLNNSGISV